MTALDLAGGPITFDDGSRGIEGYYPEARCVWSIRSPTGCAEIDVEFLASKPPHDRLEVYSSAGLFLAKFHGRRGIASSRAKRPSIAGCVEGNSTWVLGGAEFY